MRYNILIFLMILIFNLSCKNDIKPNIDGYWLIESEDTSSEDNYPAELYFVKDTLYAISGFSFVNKLKCEYKQDSILLKNSKGQVAAFYIMISKGIMKLNGKIYVKKSMLDELSLQNFELIGLMKNACKYEYQDADEFIYLKKTKDSFKYMFCNGNETSNLSLFLPDHKSSHLRLVVFVGKGITKDCILKLYNEAAFAGIYKVFLVTNSNEFDVYYGIKDNISFDFTYNKRLELKNIKKDKINLLFQ